MKYIDPPFELGETLQGTDTDGVPINLHLLGQVYLHPAQRLTGGPRSSKARFTGKGITAVVLRNISGIALQPKSVARLAYDTAGASTVSVNSVTENETNIAALEGADGYGAVLAEKRCVIVDPFLASGTSVADNEIFWGVLKGRVLLKTPYAGAPFNGDIGVGGPLVAATYNGSTHSSGGRVSNVTATTNSDTQAFSMAANLIGYALSARTTGETDEDILVDACIAY